MSKIVANGKTIEINDLHNHEIINLLKINVKCTLQFISGGEIITYFELFERTFNSQTNLIQYSGIDESVKTDNYDVLVREISEALKLGVLKVLVDKQEFIDKEPLLLILNDFKDEIIENCVKIDYDNKTKVFSILNRPINKLPNKLYYFENSDSILAFSGEDGPRLVTNKVNSFEELVCK